MTSFSWLDLVVDVCCGVCLSARWHVNFLIVEGLKKKLFDCFKHDFISRVVCKNKRNWCRCFMCDISVGDRTTKHCFFFSCKECRKYRFCVLWNMCYIIIPAFSKDRYCCYPALFVRPSVHSSVRLSRVTFSNRSFILLTSKLNSWRLIWGVMLFCKKISKILW